MDEPILPKDWGPYYWYVFHGTIYSYPGKQTVSDFLKVFPDILPCITCANHLRKLYKKHPYESIVGDKNKLIVWSVLIHNIVNKKLNKPLLSPNEAAEHFIKGYFTKEKKCRTIDVICYVVLGLIIAGLVTYIILKGKVVPPTTS